MKKTTLLVLLAYLGLTILMTWPTAQHLTDGIPGDGFDGWQNYWNLWWVKQALLVEGVNPYFTAYLDAPSGVSLLFHTLNIFNGLWTLPLQLNFGPAVAYNGVVFFSYVLAGYGAYLLALHTLTQVHPGAPGTRAAAFVGGLIFTMSPFHMAHLLGHMQVFSMVWPPFYVLWLLKTLAPWRSPQQIPARQPRNVLFTSLFLILATLVDWYHTLYLLIFTALLLLWTLWRQRRLIGHRPWRTNPPARALLAVAGVGLCFGLILSPLLLPMVQNASARPDLETGLAQNIALSADLLAFILPSEMHPLWGTWATGIANNFTSTTSERLVFAGFTVLALALPAMWRGRRQTAIRFWGLITAAFTVLALGPYLHIGGQLVRLGDWLLPLPYLLLYHTVPFIDLTRSLSRYDLMIMLGLGVLAAIGLMQLQQGRRRSWLPYAAAALICFEFLPIPYPISSIQIPDFYQQLGQEQADYTIAELPMNWDRPTPLLHQTVHRKRLLTAYTSRDNPRLLAPKTPVLQQWRYLGPDIIDQPPAEIAPTIFFDFNLRYVVLDYWQMPPGPERNATEQWVQTALPNAAPVYDDGRLVVYQTPPKKETRPYLSLGAGWSEPTAAPERTISGPAADLFLHHPTQPPGQLWLTAAAAPPQTLAVFADNSAAPLAEIALDTAPTTVAINLPFPDQTPLKLRLVPQQNGVTVQRLGLSPPP